MPIFTVNQDCSPLVTVCWGTGIVTPLDELVSTIASQLKTQGPCLRRFTLPKSEAQALLRELHHDEVDGVKLFPGYPGVVKGLKRSRRAPTF
jgi:hypothetical protein